MTEKEKVTIMVLKVDLQCRRCHKKVKKVLCKFPQIRDQIYDEKANTVTITVVCCDPEKMRDKLCRKGDGSIKSIEIKPPPKPKEPEKNTEKETEKTKESEKESKKHSEKKPKEPTVPKPPEKPVCPPPTAYPPIGFCGGGCYHGHCGGHPPCYFSGPPPPQPWYGGYGRPVYDRWGGGCNYYYGSRGDCFSDENPQGCSVM